MPPTFLVATRCVTRSKTLRLLNIVWLGKEEHRLLTDQHLLSLKAVAAHMIALWC